MKKNDDTIIDLGTDCYAIILDKEGKLIEMYLPDAADDSIVPDNVAKIMDILLETHKFTLDLSHDALIDKR